MHLRARYAAVAGLALVVPDVLALLRFSCSQLVVERLDPLVNPGVTGSPHLHQIIGGVSGLRLKSQESPDVSLLTCFKQNAFKASMDPATVDIPAQATCTTCTFAEDFSNYWGKVLA